MKEIDNKRIEICKNLKKIIKNCNVFYETFFDGFHCITIFHIITFSELSMYCKIDDDVILSNKTSETVKYIMQGFEYHMHNVVFNTEEYLKLKEE